MNVNKIINNIANNKSLLSHIDKSIMNSNYAAKILIGASVAKDAFEYAISYKQTLENKKIMPASKRKLVASLDLSTGILSCLAQIILGFTISNKNIQEKVSNFLFKDLINAKQFKALEKCNTGLVIISSLLISTVVVKRILVPFIATPLASLISKKQSNKTIENEFNNKASNQ